jgi:hypothetical protein
LPTIVGISGALRRGSFNSALLAAAVELAPPDLRIEVVSIDEFPLYDGDLEAAHFPEVVRGAKERVTAADGLLLVTPEYNNSIPGVFKNAIDWLARPPKDNPRTFGGKPVAIMGATPGPPGYPLSGLSGRFCGPASASTSRTPPRSSPTVGSWTKRSARPSRSTSPASRSSSDAPPYARELADRHASSPVVAWGCARGYRGCGSRGSMMGLRLETGGGPSVDQRCRPLRVRRASAILAA